MGNEEVATTNLSTMNKHDINYCCKMTEKVLAAQFKALADHKIYLEGCLLKPNMVKNGIGGPKADKETIATLTVQTLLRTVPPALPGIFFLSGETALDEDNEEVATTNLSTMNKVFKEKMPWHLSFSWMTSSSAASRHTMAT